MIRLQYFLKKIQLFLLEKINLNQYKVNKNIYFKGERREIKNILIYLNNNLLAHLGDQLFFEPLLRSLKNKGIKVSISPTETMKKYFEILKYQIIEKPILQDYDLIITRSDFFYLLKEERNILFIKTTNLSQRVCNMIVDEVFKFLNLDINSEINYIPQNLNLENYENYLIKKEINDNFKYIIFSNYIDSGYMFNNRKKICNLEKFCKTKAKERKYKIIHIGSNNDKKRDKRKYDFIDVDLRGKTDIIDLFYLISLFQVKEYVGMDGFIMHLFFINFKKTNICIRNKLTQKREEEIIKYVNPPFINSNIEINYID